VSPGRSDAAERRPDILEKRIGRHEVEVPKADAEKRVVKKTVRLTATSGDKEFPLLIPVHCVPKAE